MKRIFKTGCQALIMIAALAMGACGFHLKGLIELPRWFNGVYVGGDGAPAPLLQLLRNQIEANGRHIQLQPRNAEYLLIIEHEHVDKNISSVSASTTPRQYELTYSLRYRLSDRRGRILQGPASLKITRFLTVNNDRILGSDFEEATIVSEMRRDVVSRLLQRISVLNHHAA